MSRYDAISKIYGKDNLERLQNAKILVVGAGGIGCEILKNLAMLGIRSIDLIDLDTIDVSNLNRQFLFRPEHVGQSKALVAGLAAMKFNPDIKVTSYHDNIKNTKFSVSFFEGFQVVLNALDNVDARRHVNRLCLAAEVPLIDSGTTGFIGQVIPIIKKKIACYECYPKPTQKVYPICTIRSTPDKPVHCIVWAKELFKLLFGNASESMLFESDESGDQSTYMHLVNYPELEKGKSTDKTFMLSVLDYSRNLLAALYNVEVQKRIDMDTYKNAKAVPEIITLSKIDSVFSQIKKNIELVDEIELIKKNALLKLFPSGKNGWDQRVLSLEENISEFFYSFLELASNKTELDLIGTLTFDKDDLWAMKFVAAAANLRSSVFSINNLSFHDTKGVAGNIIPAIATTNAIVSGVQVMQALRFLFSDNFDATKSPYTYCMRMPTRKGLFLQPSDPEKPVASCYVCGKSMLTLAIDINETTLGEMLEKVVKNRLSLSEPMIMVGSDLLYEEGEGAEDMSENLSLKLSDCPGGGIKNETIITLEDFTQKIELQIIIKHVNNEELKKIESAVGDMFVLGGQDDFNKKMEQRQEQEKIERRDEGMKKLNEKTEAPETDDDVVMIDDDLDDDDIVGSKRNIENDDTKESKKKHRKV